MKLTNREKKLLCFLGVLIVSFLYYKFIFTPQTEKLQWVKANKEDSINNLNKAKSNVKLLAQRKESIKKLTDSIKNDSGEYFDKIPQEEVILKLDELISTSKITVNSISFGETNSNTTANTTNPKDSTKAKVDIDAMKKLVQDYNKIESGQATVEDSAVYKLKIGINFKGSYDTVQDFIKAISEEKHKIVLSDLTIGTDNGSGISGSMTLEFLGVPKIFPSDEASTHITNDGAGKKNPFN